MGKFVLRFKVLDSHINIFLNKFIIWPTHTPSRYPNKVSGFDMYKWWLVFWLHSPWMKYHLFVITSFQKSKEFQINDVKEFNHL
jgi:hypothetical protein